MMRKIFILLGIVALFSACEENEKGTVILSDKVRLLAEIEDGTIILKWNRPYVMEFRYYMVVRSSRPISNGGLYEEISRIYDFDETTYEDSSFPLDEKVYYMVIAVGTNNYIQSNEVALATNLKIMNIRVNDAILWKEQQILFMVDKPSGTIYKYNYEEEKMLDSLKLTFEPEYIDFGNNGLGNELYIPGDGGVLRIYNADDFSYVDEIDVGLPLSSVVSNNNGMLALSCQPSPWWEDPLRVYNRQTKTMIDGNGDFDFTRLRMIPETNEIIEISRNISPIDLDYYKLDAAGNVLEHKDDPYHGDYPLDPDIFRVSPDGKYFITSSSGALYDISLLYLRQVSNYSYQYNDFCFDAASEYIYGGNFIDKKIEKFPVSGRIDPVDEYSCLGYPGYVFMLEGQILCVSFSRQQQRAYGYYAGILIEKIDID